MTVAEGRHEKAVVSGVFSEGLELGTLEDRNCPEVTWVEFALRSQQNRVKLSQFLQSSRRAFVVFEGDFYGPPLSDPTLPEKVRNLYHPGSGHLGAFRTKLIVHTIRDVKAAGD